MNNSNKKTLFSGIQPSGILTIGNYMGAFKQWVDLQKKYTCIFSVVDLHALTTMKDPIKLRENILDSVALLISCGLDPKQNIIFLQSTVYEHCVLAWILNCQTFMGEVNRMTQFKDKSANNKSNINLGLLAYPCLQAADILLYNTNYIPVGADQKQHIELCRDIASRFNKNYKEIFNIPEPIIPKVGNRIMSLQDPTAKMSKSDSNSNSYIGLLDDPDSIIKKFKKAVTDSDTHIKFNEQEKPGVSNLLNLLHLTTNNSIEEIEKNLSGKGYGALKKSTAESIIELLKPIQDNYYKIRSDKAYLNKIIESGRERAQIIAHKTISKVYDAIGFVK
ncbi:MAG: tryptophan--tRNA ligase [Legionellales bacterium]|nr:tryptophan--tRNA ligase [Legionellales bacterium]